MAKILTITFAILFVFISNCYAGGQISALMQIGRSMDEMQKIYDKETKAFEAVKEAVYSGAIKKGQSKEEIKNRYGEPIVIVQDVKTKREKWVYKPETSTYFEGTKIYLFFNDDGLLDEIIIKGAS